MGKELDYIQRGDTVGPYRIVRGFKSRGGMARIFEVEVREKYRQPDLPRRMVLKVAKEEYQAALVAEADFLRRFDHPNVVRIFPLPRPDHPRPVYAARARFRFGWGWYYTMELVNGGSLEHRLTRSTPITGLLRPSSDRGRRASLLETLGIARQLTTALEHIHAQHVINLDVKPGNVLFRQRRLRFLRGSVPQAVLCDFGISRDPRYPRAGLLGIATPEYVSPEHALEQSRHHRPVDTRSDIFSLGVLLYEMLTGELPFENPAVAADPTYAPLPPRQLRSSIPPSLEEIVLKALTKNPDYRFQTASEVYAALNQTSTPLDWGAAARRTFAGVTLVACVVAGGWGGSKIISPIPTRKPPTATKTATRTLTATPAAPTLTVLPTDTLVPTVTPRPTFTPTNTPRPWTPTPAPTPGG